MLKLNGVKSNWEFVVWYLIDPQITANIFSFTRSQLMRKNYDEIYDVLTLLGHKKHPQHPEATIQKTLQNMRDKNWIIFLGQGDYKLTNEGYRELLSQKENIDRLKSLGPEDRKTLRKLAINA
jgi:DNA-binding PadR family transcriptional regulator